MYMFTHTHMGIHMHILDIKTLINELKTVIDKYSEIGIQLGLKLEKIQEIEYKYPGNTERRFTEVLNFWLGGNTTVLVRWESIVDVLNNVEKKVLAKQIHTTYCVASKDEADSKLVAQGKKLLLWTMPVYTGRFERAMTYIHSTCIHMHTYK